MLLSVLVIVFSSGTFAQLIGKSPETEIPPCCDDSLCELMGFAFCDFSSNLEQKIMSCEMDILKRKRRLDIGNVNETSDPEVKEENSDNTVINKEGETWSERDREGNDAERNVPVTSTTEMTTTQGQIMGLCKCHPGYTPLMGLCTRISDTADIDTSTLGNCKDYVQNCEHIPCDRGIDLDQLEGFDDTCSISQTHGCFISITYHDGNKVRIEAGCTDTCFVGTTECIEEHNKCTRVTHCCDSNLCNVESAMLHHTNSVGSNSIGPSSLVMSLIAYYVLYFVNY